MPFRVLITPFILQPVAPPPVPAYVVTVQKGSGMSVFRPGHQSAVHRIRRARGFTLIELMVTIAVIALLAAVAAPAMVTLMNSNRLSSSAGELTAALQLARAEAVRRSATVTVCGSADGIACTNGADWANWIVLGTNNMTAATDVVRSGVMPGNLQINGPAGGVVFSSAGLIPAQANLTVCIPTDQPAENQRVLTVMLSGAVLTARNNGGGACP